jgi:hypothetical protein
VGDQGYLALFIAFLTDMMQTKVTINFVLRVLERFLTLATPWLLLGWAHDLL